MKTACVFLSSREPKIELDEDIKNFASFISKNNLKLMYGGGKCGLMGKLSKSVFDNGGETIGITLPMFDDMGVTPDYLDQLTTEENFYLRKKSMIDKSDFFVIFPGGVGTADEFFDIFNHLCLGLENKNIYVFNKDDCWTDLLKWIDKNIELNMLKNKPDGLFVSETINDLQNWIEKNEF